MKTVKFSLMLCTRDTDIFITLDENTCIYGIHSKRVSILYKLITPCKRSIQKYQYLFPQNQV